jgi:hypothetical protein
MEKFRNEWEERQKADHRRNINFTRSVGVTSSTIEGSGWHGSEETKEEKEKKKK